MVCSLSVGRVRAHCTLCAIHHRSAARIEFLVANLLDNGQCFGRAYTTYQRLKVQKVFSSSDKQGDSKSVVDVMSGGPLCHDAEGAVARSLPLDLAPSLPPFRIVARAVRSTPPPSMYVVPLSMSLGQYWVWVCADVHRVAQEKRNPPRSQLLVNSQEMSQLWH